MASAVLAAPPAASRGSRGQWFSDFLIQELSPYPGRGWTVARMTIAATIVMICIMVFRILNAALGAYHTLLFSRDSAEATVRSVVRAVCAAGVSLLYMLDTFIGNMRRIARFDTTLTAGELLSAIDKAWRERAAINASFDQVRNAGDSLIFEFGAGWQKKLEMRDQIRQWQPQLRTFFCYKSPSLITVYKTKTGRSKRRPNRTSSAASRFCRFWQTWEIRQKKAKNLK